MKTIKEAIDDKDYKSKNIKASRKSRNIGDDKSDHSVNMNLTYSDKGTFYSDLDKTMQNTFDNKLLNKTYQTQRLNTPDERIPVN